MNKKLLPLIIVLTLTFFAAGPAMAAKSYFAERYDVTLAVQPDGSLIVTETIVFRFDGGPYTYLYRDLEYANLDEIDRLQASMDGQGLPQGTQPGQVEIATGRPLKVTWHFAPTSDSTHEFVLTYRVLGAIRQDVDADSLTWRAIPEDHDYTISRSVIRIEYPPAIAPINAPSLDGSAAEVGAVSQGAVFTTQQIEEDTWVDVSVRFPRGSLVAQPPAWQAEQQQQAQRSAMGLPFGLGAAAITAMLGLVGVILAGFGFRRSAHTALNSSQSFTTPPRELPPALAARLAGGSVPFLGTLFDLAQRGMLLIEEGPKKWGSRTFEVIRQPGSERLQPHEQIFMSALFRKARNDRVALNEIASLAGNGQFSQALDQEMTAAGWRDAQRAGRRGRFLAGAAVALVLGLCLFLAGLLIGSSSQITESAGVILGAALMGVGGALSGIGLLALIMALSISTLSDEGVQQAAPWNSFTGHLRSITRGREPVISPDLFERYLPYAAGFGIAAEWARFFQKQANIPTPEWFQGLQTSLDEGSFVAVMAAITAANSSASAAAGAGGAASGGGSSGAG